LDNNGIIIKKNKYMEVEVIKNKKLTASDGKLIHKIGTELYCKFAYLGIYDSVENYEEVDEDTYNPNDAFKDEEL
jgi:hypothetical protein